MKINRDDISGEELVSEHQISFTFDGCCWLFLPNKPRFVRDEKAIEKALKNGAVRVVEAPPPPPEPEPEPEVVEEDPLVVALEGLIEEGNPENFKKDGTPKAAVVNKLAGKAVTTEERDAAWQTALNK